MSEPVVVHQTQNHNQVFHIGGDSKENKGLVQKYVKGLYEKYEKDLQRWKDYKSLFWFLGYVILFFGVLFVQRQASTAHQVFSTVAAVLKPSADVLQGNDDVYKWLNGVLTAVWQDPQCGDGVCEAPFEFAAYSRFGCRADCGMLTAAQNLTQIQVDIYWDFAHPVGSIPSSDLMQQAAWNLCPANVPYVSTDCYFADDIGFDRLANVKQWVIADAPDGEWDLIVRNDIFNKIRGAVRDTVLVNAAAYYYKIYTAAAGVLAEQSMEADLLQRAITYVDMGFIRYADTIINATYPNATEYNFNRTQAFQSLLLCQGLSNGTTNATDSWYQNILSPIPSPSYADTTDATNFMGNLTGSSYWARFAGSGLLGVYSNPNFTTNSLVPGQYHTSPAVSSSNPPFVWVPLFNVNGTYAGRTGRRLTSDPSNVTYFNNVWCRDANALLYSWSTNYTSFIRQLVLDLRLGNRVSTGKIAQRNRAQGNIRTYLANNFPELVDPIFNLPTGTIPFDEPVSATLSSLSQLYLDSLKYQVVMQRAEMNMTRRFVYNSNYTLVDLRQRAAARLIELADQQLSTRTIQIPPPINRYHNYTFNNMTVGQVVSLFNATGAVVGAGPNLPATATAWLPAASNRTLGPLMVSYNLVSWNGNTTAYFRCDLANRASEYVGTCFDMQTTCVASGDTSGTRPWNCTSLATNQTIGGTMANIDYRVNCEIPCETRADCNNVCECYGSCGATQYCSCQACIQTCSVDVNNNIACRQVNANAAADTQFNDVIRAANFNSINASRLIANPNTVQVGRRSLQQTATEAQLANVLSSLGQVTTRQQSIAGTMATIKSQVDNANALALARAQDTRVIDLIAATRADIAQGQTIVQNKLDDIIGKQNQALAAAAAALNVLSNIQSLADKQLAQLKTLDSTIQSQLAAIQVATTGGVISLQQALSIWKNSRRLRALTFKAARLSNIPCNNAPYLDNYFTLDNGNIIDNTTSRIRLVGLTNRVVGGMLVHQTRTNETLCPPSKFDSIQKICTGPQSVASFGVDPVFKRGTQSYDPDFDDVEGQQVVPFYNCSELLTPTYNISFLNQTVNQIPYCAELYSPQNLPYAYHFFPLEGKPDGFPVWFDINLSSERAQAWFTWVQEGLFLDQNTKSMSAELTMYNAPLRMFAYYVVTFNYGDGGSIKVDDRLYTARVELYKTYEERVEYGFTILLTGWTFWLMIVNIYAIVDTQRTRRRFYKYFWSAWNWIELSSNGLLCATMSLWWIYVLRYANKLDLSLRYNVYADLNGYANFLALNNNGRALTQVNQDMNAVRALNEFLNLYFALHGFNIVLLIARILRKMDFQPRLGIVTRALWLAGPDLIHFAMVAGMVFVGYSMMAHLIFGNAIEAFGSFGDSINTCFEILLGNIAVNDELRNLGGLQAVAGALFFWSYELLVFMVLLNFLLAIIVDAFAEVKELTHEDSSVHTELLKFLRIQWLGLSGVLKKSQIDNDEARAMLQYCVGADDEADERERIARRLQAEKIMTVLNEDLDEQTLHDILMECMRDAPGDNTSKSKKASWLARIFNRRRTMEATPEEIALAAHYIIDRFGAKPTDEELKEQAEQAKKEQEDLAIMAGQSEVANVEEERDQLALALQRLAEVQRELSEGQRNLLSGQKQLAEQQSKLVHLMNVGSGQ